MDDVESRRSSGLNGCEPDAHARARLLRAAADVFDRKGYAAASVREIVEQAGITKPVLYYHFGSKEGILLAILEEGARQFQRALASAVGRPGTARERLVGLCEEIFTLFKQNVPVVRVAHAVYFGPREGLPAFDFNKFDGALADALRRLVEEGMATGELRRAPVEDVATAINGVIGRCTDLELNPHARPIGCDGLHRVLDLIFDGLSATRDVKEN
jgi:AcrR family transcriptional regulator